MRRFWPTSQRREHNEIIGWQVSVLGTYAVIMGFMLYAVWTDYNAAEMTMPDAEANCLVNVFRLSQGLAPADRDQIQKLSREYACRCDDHGRVARHG